MCPGLNALVLLREDKLSPEETGTLKEHLAGCAACRQRSDRLELGPIGRYLPTDAGGEACPEAEAIAAFREGLLPRRQYRQIERHLSLCRLCLWRSGLLFAPPATSWGEEAATLPDELRPALDQVFLPPTAPPTGGGEPETAVEPQPGPDRPEENKENES